MWRERERERLSVAIIIIMKHICITNGYANNDNNDNDNTVKFGIPGSKLMKISITQKKSILFQKSAK
jgi:hypothetical protein